jgi:MbtH protein
MDNISSPTQADTIDVERNDNKPSHSVLINAEEQYSLWLFDKPPPSGWKMVFSGNRQDCLDYIDTVWIDMRPKSVRS